MIPEKNCLVCGCPFQKRATCSRTEWANRKHCSRDCLNLAPRSAETRLKQRLAKLGKPSWNKGIPHTETHKLNLRGKRAPFKDTSRMKGRRPWNKIGDGITPVNERIRKSPKYKKWVKRVFERDNYTCKECGKHGGNLHAHHKKPFALYTRLRFVLSNGITLCVPCHRKTDSFGTNQWTKSRET